jgi:SAM-dependent methyltransferase
MINLNDKRLNNVDINSVNRISVHKEILNSKRMIKEVFFEFHHLFNFIDLKYFSGSGMRLEIGAGSAPIKETYSDVFSSDIVPGEGIDFTFDAVDMKFKDSSLRAVFAQNVLHHLPNPNGFFLELDRVLSPGGGAVFIEPFYGPLASFIYKRISKYEHFDKLQKDWTSDNSNPMSGANQALSYIIFIRDHDKFKKNYPNLEVVITKPINNYIRYILSGGINFVQIVPDFLIPILKIMEIALIPLNRIFAIHYVIAVKKRC